MKNIAVCDGFIGRRPGCCYSMGISRPELSASGNPLLLNSAEAPLTALTLYGWSKQDGTPSPDNPVPIVSAGDEGEINVTVQGGNLFNESGTPEATKDGITIKWLQDEQCFLLNGTATGSASFSMWNINIPAVKGADYTIGVKYISGNVQVPDGGYAVAYFGTSDELNQFTNWSAANLLNSDSEEVTECNANYITRFWFYNTSGVVLNNYKCRVMLNAGSTALPYMPYKQPQTLTAQTPGGLPGIPVSSGGNYTDESGQQWICDEVDFKRGKYIRRVWKGTFDGSENWSKYRIEGATSNYDGFLASNALPEPMNYRNGFCNQLDVIVSSPSESDTNKLRFGSGANNAIIYVIHVEQYDPSLEDFGLANWKAHLAQNPLEVMTYLETPIETDLSDEEMASYKALHTYSPATTVSNDAGAWMKVGYYGLTAIQKLEKEALMINGGKT